MQPSLDDRTAVLEAISARYDQMLQRQDAIIANHDSMVENIVAVQERLLENQNTLAQLLAEVREDAAVTRRLWFRLAQRYGWLEDEQNGAQPAWTSGWHAVRKMPCW